MRDNVRDKSHASIQTPDGQMILKQTNESMVGPGRGH